MNRWTELVSYDPCPGDPFKANNTPIYQTATFELESLDGVNQYDYTRSGNPTRTILQKQLAKLECGEYAFAFNSGMAALTAILGSLKQGDHIVASYDLYGGTHRLLSQRLIMRGISFTLVDTTDLSAIDAAFQPNTRLLFIETPSNPLLKITDIKKTSELAKQKGVLLVVDNTLLSPWLQQPLTLGADVVVHSATKHLSGHSDMMAGVVMMNDAELAKHIAFIQNAEGCALAPFECWLLLRGLKTLGLRIERQIDVTKKVAHYLKKHPKVKEIYYPGFNDHPGFDVQHQQAKGSGSIISFTTGSIEHSKKWIDAINLFTLSVSFGSLNSLISLPCAMSHASILESSLPKDLIRLSIGIEDADDLIMDLEQASCSQSSL